MSLNDVQPHADLDLEMPLLDLSVEDPLANSNVPPLWPRRRRIV